MKKLVLICLFIIPLREVTPYSTRFGIDGASKMVADMIAELKDGESGVNAVKWSLIEPYPPSSGKHNYLWDKTDQLVKTFQNTGRKLQLNIIIDSDWALERDPEEGFIDPATGEYVGLKLRIKPEHLSDWAEFIKAVVERYDCDGIDDMEGLQYPIVKNIQIESEVENAWSKAEGYIEALKIAYQSAKEANEDIKIMVAGFNLGIYPALSEREKDSIFNENSGIKKLYERKMQFFEDFFSSDANNYYDILTIHLNESHRLDTLISNTISFFKEKSEESKTIWFDDMMSGPNLSSIIASPEESLKLRLMEQEDEETLKWYRKEQSKLLIKKCIMAFAEGVKRIFVSTDVDWVNYFLPIWRYQGLITISRIKKPSYYTFALLISELDGFTEVEKLNTDKEVFLYRFRVNYKDIFVGWSENGEKILNLSSYISRDSVMIKYPVLELNENNEPAYHPDETYPKDSVLINEVPVFIEPYGSLNIKEKESLLFHPTFDYIKHGVILRYRLKKVAWVKIDVYNSCGEHVKTLLNNTQSAGMHVLRWNTESLPQGIYWVKFKTENSSLIYKLLIMK